MAKILYIEDIDDNAALVRRLLTAHGHEFLWAQNAEEGLEMALEYLPDLILLDLGLPDVDGQTLSIWLRNEPALQKIPIIAMTAWPVEVANKVVEQYLLDGVINKPFSINALMDAIDTLLARKSI